MRLTRITILLAAVLVVFESCERRSEGEWELPWQEAQEESEAGGNTGPAEGSGSASEDAQEPADPAEYEDPEEDPFQGTFQEGIYRQHRFGFAATFDTGWHVFSESERAPFNVIEPGSASEENLLSVMEEGFAWFDLYAEQPETKVTLNVSILKLGENDAALTEESFAAGIASSMPEALAAEGIGEVLAEAAEMPFLDGSVWGVAVRGKTGDTDVFERQVFVRQDGYCAIVTATSYGQDRTEEAIGLMRPL